MDLHSEVFKNVSIIKRNLTIFSPYIKLEVVEKIISNLPRNVSITLITRGIVSDFAIGVSDLEALELLINKDHLVFINNRIHLKTYLYDFTSLHTGSANCTNKGLGLSHNSNFETLAYFDVVENTYLKYLDAIIGSSKIARMGDLKILEEKVKELKLEKISIMEVDSINQKAMKDLFKMNDIFASQLPYSSSVKEIYDFLQGQELTNMDDIKHDILVFQISDYKFNSYEEFKNILANAFFEHDFMRQLFTEFEDPIRFGAARQFFERKCMDNPRPNRTEVNILINNVFRWIEDLAGERCEVVQHSHTKSIQRKNQ